MLNQPDLPGSWSDWTERLTQNQALGASTELYKQARELANACSIAMESATAMLLWLGSVAILNRVKVNWPTGIWQPAGVTVAAVESDGIPIDTISNSLIDVARRLGLDPIQDTVKEGPAGLISRLETPKEGWPYRNQHRKEEERINGVDSQQTLAELAGLDTSEIQAPEPENVGNVRGLIYPSGRAFMSYLYDTPFFNTLDELVQHGNLNIRGRHETHRLRQTNISLFAAFYQGALVNLLSDFRVQNNFTMLLRQMVVLWPTDGHVPAKRVGRISHALKRIEQQASEGIDYLESMSYGVLDALNLPDAVNRPLIDPGVGIRYVTVNRYERLTRLALSVAFWRLTGSDARLELLPSDYAVADSILHCHDMGARLLEIACSRGKFGQESMRIFLRLLDNESSVTDSLTFASDSKHGLDTLERLAALSVIDGDNDAKLMPDYRYVSIETMAHHRRRWGLD